jgi:hypothetical protein
MLTDEALDFTDQLPGETASEIGLDPLLDHFQALFFERRGRLTPERLVHHVGERRTAPKRQRSPQTLGSCLGLACRKSLPPVRRDLFEAIEVEVAGCDGKEIAARLPGDRGCAEDSPESRDVGVERVRRGRRWMLTPERIDQLVPRDGFGPREKEHGQQGPLLGTAECQPEARVTRLDRTENPVVHRAS